MSKLSDNESSDSSNDFLISMNKNNLNSSFFKQSVTKFNLINTTTLQDQSDNFNEFDYSNDNNVDSSELFSRVLKNLEITQKRNFENKKIIQVPSTSGMINLTNYNNLNLSKEISNLLLQGESTVACFEEYDIDESKQDKTNNIIPQKEVQIYLPEDDFMFKKKIKKQDLRKVLQNKFNQQIRSSQIIIHKVGLLCWLSHGFFLNRLTNDPELLKIALSLFSSKNYPKNGIDLKYINKFTKWFTRVFQICAKYKEVVYNKDLLIKRILEKKVYNYKEIILLYVVIVRAMGINCRLVISLQPPPLKPKPEQLFKFSTISENNSNLKLISSEIINQEINEKMYMQKPINSTDISKSSKIVFKSDELLASTGRLKNSVESLKITKSETKKQENVNFKTNVSKDKIKVNKTEFNKKEHTQNIKTNNITNKEYDDITKESNLSISKKLYLTTNKTNKQEDYEINISKNKKDIKSKSKTIRSLLNRKSKSSSNYRVYKKKIEFLINDDSMKKTYEHKVLDKRNENQITSTKFVKKINKQQRLLSSDEDNTNVINNSYDTWVEVYVESEKSWVSINILDQQIYCPSEIYKKATDPSLYIVAWNSTGTLKDVTRRYCPHWLTDTRKKRVDEKWWSETLSNWNERNSVISKIEDEQLLQRELEQPLPKTITECKGHPLYTLVRHLLKFEALYPPDIVPLGHLKTGEAIYSRYCVHSLYSRETWIKKARVVKPAQEAYKIVKSKPKYDKFSGAKIKDQPLELFGKWQTNPYVPPEAKNGKVPRNEYGNVDLFKKCMLPKGTVYIKLPGLSRIARKLNIDCVPACVGFNFGSKGALPTFEGFVVCEEYEDILRKAWEEEQIEAQIRSKAKREKYIYEIWKKLIKGTLIREKLALKYNFFQQKVLVENKTKEISTIEKNEVKLKTKVLSSKRESQEPGNIIKKSKTQF